MAPKSTYLSNIVLNSTLRATAFTGPVTVYVALLNAGTEATGGSYARQSVTFGTAATAATISSTTAQTFTAMPATTVTQIALYDSLNSGGTNNQLYLTTVTTKTTNAGDTVTIAIAAITVTES